MAFTDLFVKTTLESVRSTMIGYATAAKLKITNWATGGTGQQILEVVVSLAYSFTAITAEMIRGFASLETSVDPGDFDPYNADNASREPAPGFLSNLGRNMHGTERTDATFATGSVTFTNAGPGARTIAPESLVFTQTGGSPPNPSPTYTNTADASIYTNPDGTVTVPAGTSVSLPIMAQVIGSVGSAPSGTITLTTTMIGCTATNVNSVVGTDRESADAYRARCRLAPARLSFGAPEDAYLYLATRNLDGTLLANSSGNDVGINRVQSTGNTGTGIVTVYYASAAGTAVAEDVTAANANIQTTLFAVSDCITFTGQSATTLSVHVAGTARLRSRPGVTKAAVAAGIVESLQNAFVEIPIGGVDTGLIYHVDLEAYAHAGYPGLYDVTVTTPVSNVTMTPGQVATLSSIAGDGVTGDWVITLV